MAESIQIIVEATDKASSVLEGIGVAGIDLGEVVAGIGAAIGTAVAALAEFVSVAAEAEEVQAKFNTLVGNSNLADFTDEMYALADGLSTVTRFDDETILSAQGMLATFGTIGKEIFPDVTKAALDLAEATGQDATSAASTLGRAFADMAGGSLGALRGVAKLTDAQKEMAEKMAKAGDVAGAQEYVIGILGEKFGGLAEKMGGTFSGQWTIFQNTIENVKEELGEKFLPLLTPLIGRLTDLALQTLPYLSSLIDSYVLPVFRMLAQEFIIFTNLLSAGKSPLDAFVRTLEILTGLELDGIVSFLKNVWKAISQLLAGDISGLTETLSRLWNEGFGSAKNIVDSIDWDGIGKAILDGLAGLGDVWIGFQQSGADFIKSIDWEKLGSDFIEGVKSIDWRALGEGIAEFVIDFWRGIAAGWSGGGIYGALIQIDWGSIFGALFDAVKDIIQGYWWTLWEEVAPSAVPAIVRGLDIIKRTIDTFIPNIVNTAKFNFDKMRVNMAATLSQILINIQQKISEISTIFSQGISEWIDTLANKVEEFTSIGAGIVANIQAGIENAWSSFVSWITAKVAAIIGTILSGLGIGTSPTGATGVESTTVTSQTVSKSMTSPARGGNQRTSNNFFGPITLKLASDSEFLQVR